MEWGINLKADNKKSGGIRFTQNLRYTIWLYFMVFILFVILLLWVFQLVIMPITYQNEKIANIKNVGKIISAEITNENYKEIFDQAAYDNGISIKITDFEGNTLYEADVLAGGSAIPNKDNNLMNQYREMILNSPDNKIQLIAMNDKLHSTTLLYATLIGTPEEPLGFIFLDTSLDPLVSTMNILMKQMFYITLTLLGLGMIISLFMARMISRPIMKITKSAHALAEGNFNVEFDGRGYEEAEALATTLNYASTEISKVDNLRRELIANISHDLRTPLTMVKAYAEMIRDLSGDNPEKREEHLNIIIQESDRLALLVNDILDLSKIESGNQPLTISEFDITEKLTEILGRYSLLSEQQGYDFTFESDGNITVKADVLKIEQVIYNLINNAVNYSGDSREINIRQKNSADRVRIEVTDHGDGIDEELLPVIFDRYYRAEKSRRDIIGTGLGLSIVKSILKSHSYPFGVESKVGEGSTFWFEIIL